MKWIETCVVFDAPDHRLAAELVANCFYDLGLKGVVLEDPEEDDAADWSSGRPPAAERHAVTGYLPMNDRLQERRRRLTACLQRLAAHQGLRWWIDCRTLDQEDWAEAWKSHFHPQRVGRRIVVKPTWRDYAARPQDIVLEIDPGMAFGTGTHATTALCICLLERHLKSGDRVLDVGTGSGILMIAAAKLGACFLRGIDRDETAVAVAARNLTLNRIPSERFELTVGHLLEGIQRPFDLVVANILTEAILDLVDPVAAMLSPSATFICSGILEEKQEVVRAALEGAGLEILEILNRDGWVAIAAAGAPTGPSRSCSTYP